MKLLSLAIQALAVPFLGIGALLMWLALYIHDEKESEPPTDKRKRQ